jgi:hypothetical protein
METDVRNTIKEKKMKLALVLGLVSATSVSAAPYYVGQNVGQPNHINLGFSDTPSKKAATAGRTDTGNIAALDLSTNYNISENTGLRASMPFYFVTKNASTSGSSRNSLGNLNIGGSWWETMTSSDKAWNYGYGLSADVFAPTARKDEANTVALANPTTDIYRYRTRGLSLVPMAHVFAGNDHFTARVAFGGGYTMVQSKSGLPTDKNRLGVNWQNAVSWHALPYLHANLEYNTVIMDTATRAETINYASTTDRAKFRHAVTPSVNGTIDQMMGAAYVTIPLDKPTRDYTNVAFGINAGYTF